MGETGRLWASMDTLGTFFKEEKNNHPYILLNGGPILEDGKRELQKVLFSTTSSVSTENTRQYCAYLFQGQCFVNFTFNGDQGNEEEGVRDAIAAINSSKHAQYYSTSNNEWDNPTFYLPIDKDTVENSKGSIAISFTGPDEFIQTLKKNGGMFHLTSPKQF
jgi:hypothetical protein